MEIPTERAPFRVPATRRRSRTVTSAFVIASSVVLASCDGSPIAELDPPEDDPIPEVMLSVRSYPDSVQGILSPTRVHVTVRTVDGQLVPDHEVTWRALEGEVGEWWHCHTRCPIWERSSEVSHPTNEQGVAVMEWILGPGVGEQRIEITAPGAEPVMHRMEAVAGVVLVGLFTLHHEADHQADLPSDTMRVHATNYRAYTTDHFGVGPILRAFEEGAAVFLGGRTTRGSGFDTVWNFHFDPSSVTSAYAVTVWNCWVVPQFTEEWMDQILGDGYSAWWSPCWGILRLVGVEEVPAPYLATLASEAVGRP